MANPWLPRWGDPAVRYDRGWTWPTAAEIAAALTQPTLKGPMKAQRYYPSRAGDQIPWLTNFQAKLPGYETTLNLPSAHVDACVASCNFAIYVLKDWLPAVREFGPAATSAMELLLSGSGPTAVALPTFSAPALPTGVAAVPPGALTRVFDMAQLVKASPGYTPTIGNDLGIIGEEDSTSLDGVAPQVKVKLQPDAVAELQFGKKTAEGVNIYSMRGTETGWQFLARDTYSPYIDNRPLLVAGTPEVRRYRVRFVVDDAEVGEPFEITVTVRP